MGCCFSAGKATIPTIAAVPIPPPIEEESVKEVVVQSVSVSTHVPVPISVPIPVSVPLPDPAPVPVPTVSDTEHNLPPPSLQTPEISHSNNKSDICSVSNSFSTATTATAASILEDDALSKPYRPPPSTRRSRPERVNRSPGGRHSPQGSKLRPRMARERSSLQANPTSNKRNVESIPLQRNRLVDGPRRRSPSPVTRGPSSARRSPMKKRGEEGKVAVDDVTKDEDKVDVEVKKEDVSARGDPEVSMECFIFL